MKPVNLLPTGSAVVVAKATDTKPSMGLVGGLAVGYIAVVAVAGFLLMGRVDSVKSETAQATSQAQDATQQTQAVDAQVQSLGEPIVDSDRQVAQGYEQTLIAAYTQRYDFPQLVDELHGILGNGDGFYKQISAGTNGASPSGSTTTSADPNATPKNVTIVAYINNRTLAASFDKRVEATRSLKDADIVDMKSMFLTNLASHKNGRYWKVTVSATFIDTRMPMDATSGSVGGDSTNSDGTGVTVASGGDATGSSLSLSLAPEASKAKPKAKGSSAAASTTGAAASSAPKNPFDVAAGVAGGGGTK